LVVDAHTGEILSHRAPARAPADGASFDDLLAGIDDHKARAAEVFEREVTAFKDRDRLLEAKFEEALRRADEEGEDAAPPVRPWDLD